MADARKSWLVLGASPTSPQWAKYVLDKGLVDVVAVTNEGIKLHPRPDYFLVFDPNAWRAFPERIIEARKAGAKIITTRLALKHEPTIPQDVVIDPHRDRASDWHLAGGYKRGVYANSRQSGTITLQFAVHNGAKQIHLVGCEGYSGRATETFDGKAGGPKDLDKTTRVQGQVITMIAAAWPEVAFTVYGDLNYTVAGENVSRVGNRWLCLGGSPNAEKYLPLALGSGMFNRSITTNRGLRLYPGAEFYWVSDGRALEKYRTDYVRARRRGTQIVTNANLPAQFTSVAQVTIDAPAHYPPPKEPFRLGSYSNGRTSGAFIVQFALNHEATTVDLVGMEGWLPQQKSKIMEWYGPLMQSIVAACPRTHFNVWGPTTYDLKGSNVQRRP